jgi:cobyrinic acid a,c-diamide synthase
MAGIPRLVVAGVSSGVGKTTVVAALAAALRARGLRVATFKCGPDFLDPTYLARASGAPCHNLDGFLMGRDAVLRTFARGCAGADVALVEGVMGLYDGARPTSDAGSAAEIARFLDAPVVAVVDAWAIARTLAAVGVGLRRFDPSLRVAGLFANRVGGTAHLELLREACVEVPVVAGLPRTDALAFPERHLGLRAAAPDAPITAWAALLEEWRGVDALYAIARSAPPIDLPVADAARGATSFLAPKAGECRGERPICRIAIARDDAFHFYYDDNLRRLEELGAELIAFSPLRDRALPPVDGVLIGGGYPELHAAQLASSRPMREALRAFTGPIYAECGGLMYLARKLRLPDGSEHEMVGLVDGVAVMRESLQALGYVEVETLAPTVLGPAGLRLHGHQFRWSTFEGPGHLYRVRRFSDGAEHVEGYGGGRVLASYVHAHWARTPEAAAGFVRACAEVSRS